MVMFKKILETFGILVITLFIPVVINIASGNKQDVYSGITAEAAYEVSTENQSDVSFVTSNNKASSLPRPVLYSLLVMFIISVASFIKYKVDKDLNEQR